MEDDNLFSNFSKQEPEQSAKKEKSFIGKKRNGEELKMNEIKTKKIPLENTESKIGQNL